MDSDSLASIMKLFGTKKNKRYVMQKYLIPRRDEHGQWWWGYQKVYINILPEEEKMAYLKKMGYGVEENK